MQEDHAQDFRDPVSELDPDLAADFMMISLVSHKIKVLVVGGGKAGLLKAGTFSKNGCRVWVLSKNFTDGFERLRNNGNVTLIQGEYMPGYIEDKHLIVIATGDKDRDQKIGDDCEQACKLYLMCSDFREGMFVTPAQRQTQDSKIAVHTFRGSPKVSVLLADALEQKAREYDGFVGYVGQLRETLKNTAHFKPVMDFVSTPEFYEYYKLGEHRKVLKMFFGGIDFED